MLVLGNPSYHIYVCFVRSSASFCAMLLCEFLLTGTVFVQLLSFFFSVCRDSVGERGQRVRANALEHFPTARLHHK